jgi:hypothetical protein
MRRDGTQVRNLTQNPGNDFAPTWFSLGILVGAQDWIAFTSTRDGNQEVYKVRPDASGLTNLTQNPANDHSPSGFAGGAIPAGANSGNSEIYVMTDTGGAKQHYKEPAQDLDPQSALWSLGRFFDRPGWKSGVLRPWMAARLTTWSETRARTAIRIGEGS